MEHADTDVIEDVRRIVADQIGKDSADIGDDTPLESLGIASLDVVEIAFALEEKFDIDVPFDAGNAGGAAFGSVSDIARAVTAQLNEKG